LKSYEKEAFLKSFLLFFVVQFTFFSLLMWQYHKSISHQYEMTIMHEIRQCSYTLACEKYEIDFVDKVEGIELNCLYRTNSYYMLFSIPTMQNKNLKISLSKKRYNIKYKEILNDNLLIYLLFTIVIIFISGLFAKFSLNPLRKALTLNDEFVKDMLHDINTPLSSLKINFKILQKKFAQDEAIRRSEEAIQTIHDLQANLSYFLAHNPLVEEKLALSSCLEQRVKTYELIYPNINFSVEIDKHYLKINPQAFVRIVDNLLSNAAKYNKTNGEVKVRFSDTFLIIEDSGIGIKEPSKVFNRFYRETSRGMGIGLHVVKKLCDDLNIEVSVQSQLEKGTKFSLNLKKVMLS